MAINGGNLDGSELDIAWTTGGHTGIQVPIFAYGPGSKKFGGVQDNTMVPRIAAKLMKIKDFPKVME